MIGFNFACNICNFITVLSSLSNVFASTDLQCSTYFEGLDVKRYFTGTLTVTIIAGISHNANAFAINLFYMIIQRKKKKQRQPSCRVFIVTIGPNKSICVCIISYTSPARKSNKKTDVYRSVWSTVGTLRA